MRAELPEGRDHGVADGVMLLTSLCVAVASWSYLANISAGPVWRIYGAVGLTFFFALAGLTRRSGWAHAIRFLMGIWTITMPFLLGLIMSSSALWTLAAMGIVLTALSVPRVVGEKVRDLVRQTEGWGVLSLPR